jgi:hypothetical protein
LRQRIEMTTVAYIFTALYGDPLHIGRSTLENPVHCVHPLICFVPVDLRCGVGD